MSQERRKTETIEELYDRMAELETRLASSRRRQRLWRGLLLAGLLLVAAAVLVPRPAVSQVKGSKRHQVLVVNDLSGGASRSHLENALNGGWEIVGAWPCTLLGNQGGGTLVVLRER